MKISEDLIKFHLHDGSILGIQDDTDNHTLTFEVELCDWDGDLIYPDGVYGKHGILIFYGFIGLSSSIPLDRVDFASVEILHFKYAPELDTSSTKGVEILCESGILPETTLIQIQFSTVNFEWVEYGDRQY